MTDLFLHTALLPDGWAHDVRLSVSATGEIIRVDRDADASGADSVRGIVVPGIPNLHSHAFQRAMAGLTERGSSSGDTFWSWRERMYAFLETLAPEDVEAIAAQLFTELLRHGYTAVAEFHYLRNDPTGAPYADPVEVGRRVLSAAASTGIGVTLLPAVYVASDFGGKPPTHAQRRFVAGVGEMLSDVEALRDTVAERPDTRLGLALHSLRAVPPEELATAVAALDGLGPSGPVHVHIAEQEREVEACVSWSGRRPVEWLMENAPVDARWCLVHATHVTLEETEALARSRAVVGLCPTTEANLGDGIFPFAEHAAAGGTWGVGTDSHVSVSPVADLRLLEYGQRLSRRERNVAAGPSDRSTGRVLLEGAWAGGAQACGRPLGRITEGCRADLVVLDEEHPALVGREGDAILDAWIFSGEDTPVRDVMVGGAWVVREGRHAREEEALEAYRATARRLGRS